MARPFATAFGIPLTTVLESNWLTLVGYDGAGAKDRGEAWLEATVGMAAVEAIECGTGAVDGKLAPASTLIPVPARNMVEKTIVTIARATPVIARLSLTFPSPSNYQSAARLNKWPPSFRADSYTILFYPFCWRSRADSRY
jgi:hypothetical protein